MLTNSRKLISMIVSLFVLGFGPVLAAPAPLQGDMIARETVGDSSRAFVGRYLEDTGIAFGYDTYIAGYDGPLFSSAVVRDETTAYFTFFIEPVAPSSVFKVGNIVVTQTPARVRLYFDDTPDGDFDNPDSFRDGVLIGESEYDAGVIKIDRVNGTVTVGTINQRQLISGSFELNGRAYTFRQANDQLRLSVIGRVDAINPVMVNFAGEEVFLGPGN